MSRKSSCRTDVAKTFRKKLKRRKESMEFKKEAKLERENVLVCGKFYRFFVTGKALSSDRAIWSKPCSMGDDSESRVVERIKHGELVMFLEMKDTHDTSGDTTHYWAKIGYKDIFGWVACEGKFLEPFKGHKYFRRVHALG